MNILNTFVKGIFNTIKWIIIFSIAVAVCMTVIQYGAVAQ